MSDQSSKLPRFSPKKRALGGVFSPLILRIMAVNLLALAMLGGGLLYLNQFRQNLVANFTDQLIAQAEIISGALGEAATGGDDATSIDITAARQILGRVLEAQQSRARLFAVEGPLLVDSRFLGPGVSVFPLAPPDQKQTWQETILNSLNDWLDQLTFDDAIPIYRERAGQEARDYDEVITALTGEREVTMRRVANGDLMISVAVPIQRFRRVLGALMVSADTSSIQDIVRQERISILRIIGLTFLVTMLLSFFLASTIARPIQRLAHAADRVRRGTGRSTDLAKSANRRDEIGHLSQTVYDMTMALYAQLRAVESFAADVAHEIKNPLSSIRSALETIERTDNPEVHEKLLAIVQDDLRRIDRLITDISDASRLDAQLSGGKTKKVDMGLLVGSLVDAYQTTGKGGEVQVNYHGPSEGDIYVRGIDSRLGQVIGNLLDNAVSFSTPQDKIDVTLEKYKTYMELTVDDQGPGLPPGATQKIFDRFYSERPPDEAFGTHSGLGLSISRQIIEAHHGSIEAVNILDEEQGQEVVTKPDELVHDLPVVGARFIIRLPLA